MFKLFAGHNYYPSGGYNDYVGSFDSLEKAIEGGETKRMGYGYLGDDYEYDWWHVVQEDQIVAQSYTHRRRR